MIHSVALSLVALLALHAQEPLVQEPADVALTDVALADVALTGGRVIDPASGVDAVATVLVRGDRVVAITEEPATATTIVDCTGLVVAPGFVDVLANLPPERAAHELKVLDGVTTVVGMHGGPVTTLDWLEKIERSGALVNYGTAVGHGSARFAAGALDPYQPVTREQLERMRQLVARSITAGAVGVGFGINYTPAANYDEVVALFEVAAEHGVPAHVHSRYKGSVFPETIQIAVQEVISAAAVSGASTQIVHIASSAVGSMDQVLHLIDGAREHGIDIAADVYPYNANMTRLDSAIYDPGWQERFGGIEYEDVMVLETGERLTEQSFGTWRARGANVIAFFIPEDELRTALRHSFVMVASDGTIRNGAGHPRGAGTFARVLGHYVRDEAVLTLREALRKITRLPASRLESAAPTMKMRGRLVEGAFADITVFDPRTIADRATFTEPAMASVGIHHVLVNGTFVVRDGKLVDGATPGRPVVSE